ncbi:hypothetical protein [Streptomyces sp. NPDC001492]
MNTQPTPPTDQQLNDLETLAKNIPAGPWTVDDTHAELRGSHGNLLADLWDDRLGAYFAALSPDAVRALVAEVRRLRAALANEERQHGDTIDDRDHFHEMADKLAYAVAPEEVIGEHSSMNCPWDNALDLITPMAEVDKLRQQLAAGRAQAWRDLADRADPQRPEVSFFGDHGHQVGAWMRKQAEYEDRNAAVRPAVETGA